MADYKCNACGGTFTSPQRDGTTYFHACPPLGLAELTALQKAGDPLVTPELSAMLDQANAPGNPDGSSPPAVVHAQALIGRLNIRRAGHVDQNISSTKPRQPEDGPVPPVSAGAGVTKIGA